MATRFSLLSALFLAVSLFLPTSALSETQDPAESDNSEFEQQLQAQIQRQQQQLQQQMQEQQQAQQRSDRKSGQQMAALTAGIAAGVAGLSCLELYRQAEEARAAMRYSEAERLSMMAAQQCAQAAQNAANSGQNQGGADTISAANMPAAEQNRSTAKTAQSKPVEPGMQAPLKGEVADTPISPQEQIAKEDAAVAPSAFENSTTSELAMNGTSATNEGSKALPEIPRNGLVYDESARRPDSATNGGAGFGMMGAGLAAGGKSTSHSLFDLLSAKSESQEASSRRKRKDAEEPSESGAEGGESAEGSGSPLKSMLAGLMNGTPASEIANPSLGGAAGEYPSNEAVGQKAPNIFEYAGYQYRKLSRGGEVGRKSMRKLASTKS